MFTKSKTKAPFKKDLFDLLLLARFIMRQMYCYCDVKGFHLIINLYILYSIAISMSCVTPL